MSGLSFDSMVGRRIAELRQRRQLSQAELGKSVGVVTGREWHRQTVSVIEKGERGVTGADLIALARVFGVTVARLLLPEVGIDRVEMPGGATMHRDEIELAIVDSGRCDGDPAGSAIAEVGSWLSATLSEASVQLDKLRAVYDVVELGPVD